MTKFIIKNIFFILPALICTGVPAYLFPEISNSSSISMNFTTQKEIKAVYEHSSKIHFLNKPGSLFESNGLEINVSAALSPISAGIGLEAVFTPIAFIELSAGAESGSGWNLKIARGLAINKPDGLTGNRFENKTFGGIVHREKAGAAFQIDTGAVIPGDWTHIILRTYHEFYHKALTCAGDDQSWLWEADGGDNRNGYHYYIQNVIGYKIPSKLSFIGFMMEAERSYYKEDIFPRNGENLWQYIISGIVNFSINEKIELSVLTQIRTINNYTPETGGYDYYRQRIIDSGKPRKWEFYRVIASADYKF